MGRVIFLLSIYILGLVLLLLGTEGRLSIPLITLIIMSSFGTLYLIRHPKKDKKA